MLSNYCYLSPIGFDATERSATNSRVSRAKPDKFSRTAEPALQTAKCPKSVDRSVSYDWNQQRFK